MNKDEAKPPVKQAENAPPRDPKKPLDLTKEADSFAELENASKQAGLFGRMQAAFHDMLETSRGSEREEAPALPGPGPAAESRPAPTADDLAIRRAKNVNAQHMIVPEGVIISGSLTSSAETEISGRVEGDVSVEGRLFLGPTALITGNVRASVCRVEGLVEGKMECSQEIDLGRTGRLSADALAGKRVTVAGQVMGTVSCGGVVRLITTGRIEGDIRSKQLIIEEGATFNGRCTMRTGAPTQKTE